MLSKWLTEILVLLAVGLGVACVCLWLHEHDICPLKAIKKVMRKMSFIGICVLALWAVPLIQYGSTKGGGTNNVQNVANVEMLPMTSFNTQLENGNIGTDNNFTMATLITSTNTTRTITGDDFRRGFVMSRVGTGEAFDFAAPSNAVVCADWRAFGAATDWIYESVKWKVESVKWRMENGEQETDDKTMLRIHSDGWAEVKDGPVFYPLKAVLGIVPEANWPQILHFTLYTLHSQFWHYVTPSNTLQITWQNALLDRDTETPLSFQIEFRTDGQFTYRYDLSRCGALGDRALPDGIITNVVVGASFAGNDWTTNAIPTNVTSMTFYPLTENDAYNQDPDNDGLLTIDELFVYNTDPRHPDSDYDGLTDYEELFVYHTDPLDPYSAGGPHCDGVTVRLGGLDPFAYPEGSTNTVLEHVFYSGTTNGAFAYPQSDNDTAILKVMVSGVGTGRLIVGDSVVPLIAPPQMRGGLSGNVFTLLLPVVKGETYPAYVYGDESLTVTLDSDDFAFGALPTFSSFGNVNFPNTQATPACMHDFNLRSRFVSLPTREDAKLLTATWTGGADVSVSNVPPRSAVINANFYAGSIKEVSYSLSHPQYLFGQTQYSQPVRFCPRPKKTPSGTPNPDNPESEYSDTPNPDDPPWFSSGDGDSSTGNDGQDGHWCCYWGTCGSYCECGCDCANNPGGGQSGGDENVGDNEDFDDSCPEHYEPYEECDYAHESEYSNTVQTVQHLNGVLYIRDPPLYEPIYLDVPTEHTNCCPCPEHWENYVGVAYKSYRLNLVDSNGLPFDRTETSCYVNVAGVYPSSAVGDAEIAFTRNGDIYQHQHRTVLGVAIKGHQFDLAPYNALNPDFGYPMTVCTNLWYAPQMRLVTNVKLPGGHVRLELANASGQFTVWYPDYHGGTYRKLLDTSSTRVKNLTMAYWKALMRRATNGNTAELPIYITSSAPGTVTLKFRYWNVIDDKLVEDESEQCITSVRPPLLADMDGNGAFGDGDLSRCLGGRLFRFWTNEDRNKGDYIGQISDTVTNTGDLVVNGRLDLVNLFPAKIDLKPFIDAWGSAVTFHLSGPNGGLRFCCPDVPMESAWAYQTSDVYTTTGLPMSSATLTPVPREGLEITPGSCLGTGNAPGVLAFEAVSEIYSHDSLELQVKVGGVTLFRYRTPWSISSVRAMYRWRNIRSACGDYSGENNSYYVPWNNPDEECDGRHFIFVHGYNVNPTAAREWADSIFKRLWLSGSRSMFTAVDWYGDSSQFASLFHGDVSPDYYANVVHAFASAPSLVDVVNALPGTSKVMLAHSLGNMLVSSAAKDCGLQYSRYYMLNAAVPMEAYDKTEFSQNMIDSAWSGVPLNYRASDWNQLFQSCTNDFRSSLSWRGRFVGIANAVNCYSPTEDVLANATAHSYGEAWVQQELFKGTSVWHGLNAIPFLGFDIACEGGWGINTIYALNPAVYTPGYGFHSSVMEDITPKDAIEHPLFTPFRSETENMHSTNLFTIANETCRNQLRAKFLADAIPATSFAAGANPVSTNAVCGNISYETCKSGNWPIGESVWRHSDLKNVAYFFNWKLFYRIKNNDGGDINETQQQNGD